MKKITILIITLLFANYYSANAQTDKGRLILGASTIINSSGTGPNILSVGYATYKVMDSTGQMQPDPDTYLNFNILPRFGIFIFKNFAAGLDLKFGIDRQTSGTTSDYEQQIIIGLGPFIRYYIPSNKVKPFFEGSMDWGLIDNAYSHSSGDDFVFSNYGGGIGLATMIGDNVSFDIMADYHSIITQSKSNPNQAYKSNLSSFGFKFGFTIMLGSSKL